MSREKVTVELRRLPHSQGLPLPSYATDGAAGMDLVAAVPEAVILRPGEIAVVQTGISLAIPVGFEGQLRSRSGLASQHGLAVVNSPGTIDSDYRGELKVALINHGLSELAIRRGMRICQLVLQRVPEIVWAEVPELPPTRRGAGGFGHSGD